MGAMEAGKTSRSEKLKQWILSRLKEKGPIPFSQYMEWCLYHPQFGYYRSEETKIGKEGDYFTGPCVHPLFGEMVAKQLSQMAAILGEDHFDIAEMGGGHGYLCQDILGWAKRKDPRFFNRLKYILLEMNPHLIQKQKERLRPYEEEGKIIWMDLEAFERGKDWIRGCFLSNELVDAFPVHQVILDQGELKEIFVTVDRDQFQEVMRPPSDPRFASYFKDMGVTLQEGQRAEVNLRALEWMKQVGKSLARGFVLTVDYGYLAEELYAPHRRQGTLLCYYRHQTSSNPYEHLGEQDITSHVNFTALIKEGEKHGLHFTGLVPQYRFLIALGILQEMVFIDQELSELEGLKTRLSLMHLIEPEAGMGEMFKVLIQHKGVREPSLSGLRDLNSIPWPDGGSCAPEVFRTDTNHERVGR